MPMLVRSLSVSPAHIILRVAVLVGYASHQNIFLMLNIKHQIRKSADVCPSCMFPDLPPQVRYAFNMANGAQKAPIKLIPESRQLIIVIVNCILQFGIRRREEDDTHELNLG